MSLHAENSRKAFTLIEILVTLAVIAIIGTFGSVFFARFVTTNALDAARDQIAGQARKAQSYAMMGRQNGAWGIRYAANTLTLFQGASYATRNAAFDEQSSINANVAVTGLTEVVFARRTGLPSTGATTIMLTTPIASKSLTLNANGVISR